MAPRAGRNSLRCVFGGIHGRSRRWPHHRMCQWGCEKYGYETRGGKVECKVRGFSLNYKNKQILNFYTLRDNILKELDQPQSSRREMSLVDKHFFTETRPTNGFVWLNVKRNMVSSLTNEWSAGPLASRILLDTLVFKTRSTCFWSCK